MKKYHCLLFWLFLLNYPYIAVHAFLDDAQNSNDMARNKVPIRLIIAAKQDPTRENLTELILGAAPVYPLEKILELYPSRLDGGANGEIAFYEECRNDPSLFCRFFESLAGDSITHNGQVINPLVHRSQRNSFVISGITKECYLPFRIFENRVSCFRHITLIDSQVLLKVQIASQINYSFILKLLETEIPEPPKSLMRRDLNKYKQLQWLRVLLPLLRGQLALVEEYDVSKALFLFEKAAKRNPREDIQGVLDLYMADIYLGAMYVLKGVGAYNLLNEQKGVDLLKKSRFLFAKIRLGQYFLGFFGHDIKEEMGLEFIKQITKNGVISHIAYRIWAEYRLGLTNPDATDLQEARQLLDEAFKASDRIKDLEVWIDLRRAELAMGIFVDAEESPVDMPRAIKLLKSINPAGLIHLYKIYCGVYGEEFKNTKEANRVLDILKKREGKKSTYFDIKQGIEYLSAGNIQDALRCFERHPRVIISSYYLGCIYSNPKYEGFYNIEEAMSYLSFCAKYNFRDARTRLAKLVLVSLKNDTPSTEDDVFQLFDQTDQDTDQVPQEPVAHTSDDLESEPERSREGAKYLTQKIQDLDERAPVRSLSNAKLQEAYDGIGRSIKWRNLLQVVKAFGGSIDMTKKQIKFLHSDEVFSFHLLHSGNEFIFFNGYWGVLKAMIDHEYKVLCEQEATACPPSEVN